MRCSHHGKFDEVNKGQPGPAFINRAGRQLTTKDGTDLKIDQLGRGQLLISEPGSCRVSVTPVVGQCHRHHAGVNDDHGRFAPPLPQL
jgi:hypothetical protein